MNRVVMCLFVFILGCGNDCTFLVTRAVPVYKFHGDYSLARGNDSVIGNLEPGKVYVANTVSIEKEYVVLQVSLGPRDNFGYVLLDDAIKSACIDRKLE